MTMKTHVEECWRWHHECAIGKIERDEALLRQALEALERNQYAVADTAPHTDVMDYNAAITALRERLGDTT